MGIGIVAAVLALVLRQHRPEYALLVSLGAGVFILYRVCVMVVPIMNEIDAVISASAIPSGYVQVLLRALGLSFVTQIACDTCADAGEKAIAAKVEIAGKIAVLAVSMPLFQQVLGIVRSLVV